MVNEKIRFNLNISNNCWKKLGNPFMGAMGENSDSDDPFKGEEELGLSLRYNEL